MPNLTFYYTLFYLKSCAQSVYIHTIRYHKDKHAICENLFKVFLLYTRKIQNKQSFGMHLLDKERQYLVYFIHLYKYGKKM